MQKVRKMNAWEIAGRIIALAGDDKKKREELLSKSHSQEYVRNWLKSYDNNETFGFNTNARDFLAPDIKRWTSSK